MMEIKNEKQHATETQTKKHNNTTPTTLIKGKGVTTRTGHKENNTAKTNNDNNNATTTTNDNTNNTPTTTTNAPSNNATTTNTNPKNTTTTTKQTTKTNTATTANDTTTTKTTTTTNNKNNTKTTNNNAATTAKNNSNNNNDNNTTKTVNNNTASNTTTKDTTAGKTQNNNAATATNNTTNNATTADNNTNTNNNAATADNNTTNNATKADNNTNNNAKKADKNTTRNNAATATNTTNNATKADNNTSTNATTANENTNNAATADNTNTNATTANKSTIKNNTETTANTTNSNATATSSIPTYAAVTRSTQAMHDQIRRSNVITRSKHKTDDRITQLIEPPTTPETSEPTPPTQPDTWKKLQSIPHKPIPSSTKFASGVDWSNEDLEIALRCIEHETDVPYVNPLFLPTATTTPIRAIKWLKTAHRTHQLLIPLWVRHHWLLCYLTEDNIDFIDSAEGVLKQSEMGDIAAFITSELDGHKRKVRMMATPQQPRQSNECGLHVVLNSILASQGYFMPKNIGHNNRTISYDPILPTVEHFTDKDITLPQLLKKIIHQLVITNIPLITHEDVRKKLDNLADRHCKHFKVGWIGHNDGDPMFLEWTGTLVKKERRSWRVNYEENEGSAIVPYKEIQYLFITPLLDDMLTDLNHLNTPAPFKAMPLDGALITCKEILQAFETCPKTTTIPEEMEWTLAKTTRSKHRLMLESFKEIPLHLQHLPVCQAVIKFLTIRKKQRNWMASTMLTKTASAQGALRLAPLYLEGAPSITMKNSLYWSMAMRSLQTSTIAEIPHQPKAAIQANIDPIINETTGVARVIELSWLAAGRVGDILKLECSDVALTNDATALNIRFRRGKTASKNQYVITVPAPSPQMLEWIRTQSETKKNLLFPSLQTAQITTRLRVEDKELESRSLRRGRLQQLSKAGAEDAELLLLSRHAGIPMLRRYLSFGVDSGENTRLVERTNRLLEKEEAIEEESDEDEQLL